MKKVNQFKVFCVSNGIKQKELHQKADVGITALWRMQNGFATEKTIKKVVDCLKKDYRINVTVEEVAKMVRED